MNRTVLTDGLPIYESIKRSIRDRILSGELKPGDRVPSEHALARTLGVSRNQTRQALRDLELEGFLERTRGRGSFVAEPSKRDAPTTAARQTVSFAYPRFSPHGQTPYFHLLIRGFSDRLAASHVVPQFHYLDLQRDSELSLLRNVRGSGVRGLALLPHWRTPQVCDLIESLVDGGFPCVLFDHSLPTCPVDFVCTDNRRAYRRLTEELVRRGHVRVAYVGYNLATSVMEERLAGYRRALERADIPYTPGRVIDCDVSESARNGDRLAGGAERVLALLDDASPPTGFVCSDRLTAKLVEEVAAEAGLACGRDIEIAVMDDEVDPDYEGELTRLTAVQNGYEIGRQVAELLLARMADPDRTVEQRYVSARELFDRRRADQTPRRSRGRRSERDRERKEVVTEHSE